MRALFILTFVTGLGWAQAVPAPAAAAGYNTLTWVTNPQPGDFDLAENYGRGFQMYAFNFFGATAPPPANLSFTANYLTVGANNLAGTWSSIGKQTIRATPDYRGTCFGGGFYLEFTASWNHAQVLAANRSGGWPALWTETCEHLWQSSPPSDLWAGQGSTYEHFIEADPMEDDLGAAYTGAYGAAVHEWWGAYRVTCPVPYCQTLNATVSGPPYNGGAFPSNYSNYVVSSPGLNFSSQHRYGMLWIAATPTTPGSITYYLDGNPTTSAVMWSQFTGQAPVESGGVFSGPGTAPWTFGALDQLHLAVIIQTGNNQPMNIYLIRVWQASAAQNLQN